MRACLKSWLGASIAAVLLVLFVASAPRAEPLGAVTRLTLTSGGEVLVTDYSGMRVLSLDGATLEVTDSIPIKGKSLGIAWGADRLYVGDDSDGNIDVYRRTRRGGWQKRSRLGTKNGLVPKPNDIAIDETPGLVFAVSDESQTVMVFGTDGGLLYTIGAGPGDEQDSLYKPTGLAIDPAARLVYVSDVGDPAGFFSVSVPARVQVSIKARAHQSC